MTTMDEIRADSVKSQAWEQMLAFLDANLKNAPETRSGQAIAYQPRLCLGLLCPPGAGTCLWAWALVNKDSLVSTRKGISVRSLCKSGFFKILVTCKIRIFSG
jgi:hypothetical protein